MTARRLVFGWTAIARLVGLPIPECQKRAMAGELPIEMRGVLAIGDRDRLRRMAAAREPPRKARK